ncbi:MAG TPA: hypothetical protein VJ438_04575 [Candidatus Nanoarchaeia archaeon]|nr:hypothetical protein [Candidatus Nanoarchaeia archaeon]
MNQKSDKQRNELTKNLISLAVRLAKNTPPEKITKKEFFQRDLVGKTIEDYVTIGNPRPVFTSRESPNPEHFNVQLFTDGTFLLANSWGDGECKHIDFYYHNGKEIYYSWNLFG